MSRTREETFRLMVAHRAAAAALEAVLKDEAADEFERQKTAVQWRWGGGVLSTNLNHDAVVIRDREAFMAWLKVNYPHQVVTETVIVTKPINNAWLDEELLARLVAEVSDDDPVKPGDDLPVMDPDGGALVPGVRWVKGGGLRSVSIKPEPAIVRELNIAAAVYALDRGPMPELAP